MIQTFVLAVASLAAPDEAITAQAAPPQDRVGEGLLAGARIDHFFSPGELGPALGALALQIEDEEDPALEGRPLPAVYGTEGTWWINAHAGGGFRINRSSHWLATGGVGFSYFIADGLSLDTQFNALYFDQDAKDAAGANFSLLFRWHFHRQTNWSLYIDGGAGLLVTTDEVPSRGSNFNFTPQAGAGVSFDVGEHARLLTGARWLHVSNASLYDDNAGLDSLVFYAGLSWPW